MPYLHVSRERVRARVCTESIYFIFGLVKIVRRPVPMVPPTRNVRTIHYYYVIHLYSFVGVTIYMDILYSIYTRIYYVLYEFKVLKQFLDNASCTTKPETGSNEPPPNPSAI
jgi:hypothetical protein